MYGLIYLCACYAPCFGPLHTAFQGLVWFILCGFLLMLQDRVVLHCPIGWNSFPPPKFHRPCSPFYHLSVSGLEHIGFWLALKHSNRTSPWSLEATPSLFVFRLAQAISWTSVAFKEHFAHPLNSAKLKVDSMVPPISSSILAYAFYGISITYMVFPMVSIALPMG